MQTRTFLALLAFALTLSAFVTPASADPRRTLFAPFGQKMLVFEAPEGMCFLDDTSPREKPALQKMKAMHKHGKVLMAVFADCLQAAGLGVNKGPDAAGLPPLMDVGMIFWMNPSFGETSPLSRADYLDMREATIERDIATHLKYYLSAETDTMPQRTPEAISLAYAAQSEVQYQKLYTAGVAGATLLRGLPVDVVITHTAPKADRDETELYDLMEKFMAQQAALNGQEH